jgi:hypothetical protein
MVAGWFSNMVGAVDTGRKFAFMAPINFVEVLGLNQFQ